MFTDRRHIAVALAGAGAFLNLYAPQALLPLLAEEFRVGPADIAMIMSASAFAVAFTAPFTGIVADMLGRKRVIIAAMIALVIPTFMLGMSPDLETMVFWRFVQGLILPPIFAVTVAYIGGEWPADEATGVTGLYTAGAGLGGFLGRLLTGILAEPLGWRAAFMVDAGLTALCAIGMILLLPREVRFVRATNLTAALRQMFEHLRTPRLIATYAVGFGVLFNFIAIFTFISFHLAAPPFNLSAAALGMLFTVYLVATLATPWVGRLVGRFGRRDFVIGTLMLWALATLLTLVPSLPLIIAGLALAATAGFLCQAASQSYVATTTKTGISSAIGLYVTSFYVGGSVGAFVPGLFWTQGGWPGTVALVIAMQTAMALVVWLTWDKNGR